MDLSGPGRESAYKRLTGILVTRLRLEDLWRRKPEIRDQPVRGPLFIVGLPRSETTFLHRLLAQDTSLRSAPYWELINFLLTLCRTHPSEGALFERFAHIGIDPGDSFHPGATHSHRS